MAKRKRKKRIPSFYNVIIFVPAALLLIGAIYFWIKDLYSHSFKDAEDTIFLVQFIIRILFYLPFALQAIFLFCYATGNAILLSTGLSSIVGLNVSGDLSEGPVNLGPLKIIFVGSLLVTGQFLLLRMNLPGRKAFNITVKVMIWSSNLFFLKLLIENILYSVLISPSTELAFSYNNNFMFLVSLALVLALTILKGERIYIRESDALKYFAFTARILSLYSFDVYCNNDSADCFHLY